MMESGGRKDKIDNGEEAGMNQRQQGILFIIGAAFCFALMNLFVRLSGDVPMLQKCFFRNAVATVLSFVMLLRSEEKFKIGKGNGKYLVVRALAGTAGLICNFYAIDHLNISDASMLNKLSPFFAIIFSIFVLGEKVKPAEWGAVLAAFIGALFVVKPGFALNSFPALVGVAGGLGAGLAYTFVRKLGTRGERGNIIVLFFSAFSCLAVMPFMIFDYHPMTGGQFAYLMLAGCAATGGQMCITKAYTKAPAREISVFDYSQVVFAALLGFFFLEQVPDIYSVIGYVIIIGTALLKWKYNMLQDRKNTEAVSQ